MSRNIFGVLIILFAKVVFASPLLEQTEIMRLSKEIKENVEKAKISVKPHLEAEKKAKDTLWSLIKKYKSADNDEERMLISSKMEIASATAIKEGKSALEKLVVPLNEINSSLIDLYDLLIQAKVRGKQVDEQATKEVIKKVDEINKISMMSAEVALRYITDPAIRTRIQRVIRSVERSNSTVSNFEARVQNVRNIARRRITDALALTNEIRSLTETFRQEGLWRQFITQLRLLNAMLLKTGGELNFSQGESFAPVITQLREQVDLLQEHRMLDKDILEREDKFIIEGKYSTGSENVDAELQRYKEKGIRRDAK